MKFWVAFALAVALPAIVFGDVDPFEFLQKYGYMNGAVGYAGGVSSAVKEFQKMAGLPVTGSLDKTTLKKMNQPRCGASDISIKRNGYMSMKWRRNSLTYRFTSYSSDLTNNKVKEIIRHAFQVWSDITPLTFRETQSRSADLTVGFHYSSHGDGSSFDGKGGVLAHAFFPEDGRIHFDEAERWVDGRTTNGNTNLFYTAAHEIGHAIGLDHINNNKALMSPYHIDFGSRHGWKIPYVDRANIQNIYGAGTGGTGTGTGGSCVDLDKSCNFFMNQGHCKGGKYLWYMKEKCKKSCRFC